jgi:hypothetical protein
MLSTDFGALIFDNTDNINDLKVYLINPETNTYSEYFINIKESLSINSIFWYDGVNILVADGANIFSIMPNEVISHINPGDNVIAFSQDTQYLWLLTDANTVCIYFLYNYTSPIKTLTLQDKPLAITYDGMYQNILFDTYVQQY